MGNYRTTVILKTDIVDSTPKLAGQTHSEMGLQRKQHKQFISENAAKHGGAIFQQEGDGYLMEFPSVTDAVFAAIAMHQTLRSMQAGKGEKQRLAIRAIITVGDILHQGDDTIGMTMTLTARIEKLTPPDEIYLSHAAWLVLNKAEAQTSLVGEFDLKGFSEPEKIYRVDFKHKTRVLTDQFIVNIDVRRWMTFTKSKNIEDVEDFLVEYDDLLNEICDTYGGIIRSKSGDEYFLTFSDADALLTAIEKLCASWKKMLDQYGLGLSATIHQGDLNILRSYLYGDDLHVTFYLEQLHRLIYPAKASVSVIVSSRVKESVKGSKWEARFEDFDVSKISDDRLLSTVNEYGAYWFITEDK
ncbi:MAG TPA: adenylate/guanylate cyclase domain-containing protein [Anaerolineales bacterium]|nr:adenylate/guanylate cyclase domain-containing protein [Anaerolineales bacterium]